MYCVQWIQPVQVSVTGYFRGRSVSYVRTEQNAGCARISRGHIFDF